MEAFTVILFGTIFIPFRMPFFLGGGGILISTPIQKLISDGGSACIARK